MKPLTLQQVADFSGGRLVSGDGGAAVTSVSTDSRSVAPGDLFVALVGDRFDAHDFVGAVAAAGATGILVNRIDPSWGDLSCGVIEVPDSLAGLQSLAREYRKWLGIRIVGLTGSNGKTSTKDLTAAVLERKFRVRSTRGNLNNHIGVPLTLLSLEADDEYGVVEMGMNHAGEIKVLVDIALPDAAIVTNIGIAHIENLGSQEAIAAEKGSLPAHVPSGGVVILNANDSYSDGIARQCQSEVFTAGIGAGNVQARGLRPEGSGTVFTLDFGGETVEAFLPIAGDHMVANATLAACLAWREGISPADIAEALRGVRVTGGRMEMKEVCGVRFIDDSYNANPDSMRAGLSTLAATSGVGRKVAVMGAMGELGEHAESGHRGVGTLAASLGLDGIFSVGTSPGSAWIAEAAKAEAREGAEVAHFSDHASCAAFLKGWLKSGDVVLLKGSRSTRMENLLPLFEQAT